MWNRVVPLSLLSLLLLALGLPLATRALATADTPSSAEAWYHMDREAWLRTADERLVLTAYDPRNGPNLDAVPLQLGAWTGRDQPITNLETFPTLDSAASPYSGFRPR